MATIGDTIRTKLFAAIRDATVATAAGVGATPWAATALNASHVFDNTQTPLGAVNRGRLPVVVFFIDTQPFTLEAREEGRVETTIRMHIQVGGSNRSTAQSLAEGIMAAIFAVIRSDTFYWGMGGSSLDAFDSTPFWHTLKCTLTVQHTYDPTTF